MEYTTELERIDEDTWHPHLYDFSQPKVADQWGTANQMNEFVAAKSFNEPDRACSPPRRCDAVRQRAMRADATFAYRREPARERPPPRAGVVSDAGIHPLPADLSVLDLVRAGLPAALAAGRLALAGAAVPLDAVRLLPPLGADRAGLRRLRGARRGPGASSGPDRRGARVVPGADVLLHQPVRADRRARRRAGAAGSQLLDFELEVAVVIGQDGASLTPEQAREHIFGYTVLNDWSARDLQRREMKVQLGPAKGKDFATTLGPWLVTADELEPYRDADGFLALDLRAHVNGELIGQDLLSNMGWPFEELIAYASRGTEVRAATCSAPAPAATAAAWPSCGGAAGGSTRRRCAPGDVVELTVEGIGAVRNRVVAGLSLPPVREARARSVPRARKRASSHGADRRGGDQLWTGREQRRCSSTFPATTCGTWRSSPRSTAAG